VKTNVNLLPRPSEFFCSHSSQKVEESLLGTAPHVNAWFLLEHHGKWGHDAFSESNIPDSVKNHVNHYLNKNPLSRLLLIKRNAPYHNSGLAFFVALANHPHPPLYRFHIDNYDDLLDFDMYSLGSTGTQYQSNLSSDHLFLICTNGVRDQCCAKHGIPVYAALQNHFSDSLWQSSHQGGHRFAPNLLCLPHGLSYGRVFIDDAAAIVNKHSVAEIHLPNLRGRASYPQHVQAAEGLLRVKTGDTSISSLSVSELIKHSEHEWTVQFASLDGGSSHQVRLAKRMLGTRIFASCVGEKQIEISEYHLLYHTVS